MKLTITRLERPEHCGDWHDKPLRWVVTGAEIQKFSTKKDAMLWARSRRKAASFKMTADSTTSIETIMGACIVWKGKSYFSYSHANALEQAREVAKEDNELMKFLDAHMSDEMKKGFITSKDRFVDRMEAYEIAKNAGQLAEEYNDRISLESYMVKKWIF